MLDSLRKGAGSWAAKILLGLLILSFAVWGIADVYTGFGRQSLASVGSREISTAEFEQAYQSQINALSNRLGRQITSDEIRALALPQQVLSRLVGAAAVDMHAEKLGLGTTDAVIAENILQNPAFQDAGGKFSRQRFEQVLRANNLTEQGFVNNERIETIRNQLIGAIAAPAKVPQVLIDAINRYQNETRTLAYFLLPDSAAGDIPAPVEDQIKAYYDQNKAKFTLPEYRKIRIVEVSAESLQGRVEVKEDDIKATYDLRKDDFGTPEKRKIEQIAFPDLASAQAAYDRLSKKKGDFLELAKELGFKEADLDLGVKAKRDLADQKIAEAAFALKKGEISKPVEGVLSTAIVRVSEIIPGETKSYDQVREQIRKDLAVEGAKALINDLGNKIEDERAAGKALTDIAASLNLQLREVVTTQDGSSAEAGKQAELPAAKDLLKGIFETEVGEESYPAVIDAGGSVYYDVIEIIPSKLRPLDEVKAEVVTGWRQREVRTKLAEKAGELVKRINSGESLAAVAKVFGAEVKTSKPLKRTDVEPGIPLSAISQAFTLTKSVAGSVAMQTGGRLIFALTEITPPPAFDAQQAGQAQSELENAMATDYAAQYLAALQSAYGVRLNNAAIANLTGQQ